MRDFHPYAELFPLIEGEDFNQFCADFYHGLVHPIVLHRDGRILDGRNRERACDRTGAEPRYTTFETDAEDYDAAALAMVMSSNLHRRDLNTFQRADIAEKYEALFAVEAKKRQEAGKADSTKINAEDRRSETRAAKAVGISRTSYKKAKKVKKEAAPEVIEVVRKGEKSIDAALKTTKPKAEKVCEANVAILAVSNLQRDAKAFIKSVKVVIKLADTVTDEKDLQTITDAFSKARDGMTALERAFKAAGRKLIKKADINKADAIANAFATELGR